jgi:alkylated DNA repair dioxygenase AlkB
MAQPITAAGSVSDIDVFGSSTLPDGFGYRPGVLSAHQERELVHEFKQLPFAPFQFHGFTGNRRTVSFGFAYDFAARQVRPATPLPSFLNGLRQAAADMAAVPAPAFEHAMVTEYAPGAGIGWHKDKAEFGEVMAFSFISPCTLRFRKKERDRWVRSKLTIEPRSAYVLSGPARWDWQHSIPPQPTLRYSVTFRTRLAD